VYFKFDATISAIRTGNEASYECQKLQQWNIELRLSKRTQYCYDAEIEKLQ